MLFPYLVNFYLQIQNPINLISMPTNYLESFGADLSKNELFQCVSILLTRMSTAIKVLVDKPVFTPLCSVTLFTLLGIAFLSFLLVAYIAIPRKVVCTYSEAPQLNKIITAAQLPVQSLLWWLHKKGTDYLKVIFWPSVGCEEWTM